MMFAVTIGGSGFEFVLVVWKAEYSSFGKAKISAEDVENNLRFPGQYFDFAINVYDLVF